MKKDSNSNKKRLKLRRIEDAKKVKRLKSRMAQARRALVDVPKESVDKKKILSLSLFVGLFFLLLIYPIEPMVYPRQSCKDNNLMNMSMRMAYTEIKSPRELFYVAPAKKKVPDNFVLYNNVSKIIKNTPMEKMTDAIVERNDTVAAFIVGIAMKESKFGKYSPKKNGKECYNYWGYRGRENTTKSGYSCFDSPKHAVRVVGDRIEKIVKSGAKTPAQMISWKCGSTCAGHSQESVDKWIADVGINYYKIQDAIKFAKK